MDHVGILKVLMLQLAHSLARIWLLDLYFRVLWLQRVVLDVGCFHVGSLFLLLNGFRRLGLEALDSFLLEEG